MLNAYRRQRINRAFSPFGGDTDWDKEKLGHAVADNPSFAQRQSEILANPDNYVAEEDTPPTE